MASIFFLIVYDALEDRVVTRERGADAAAALDAYEAAERSNNDRPGTSVVLVSADSLATVQALYANYFGRAQIQGSAFEALGA